MAYYSYLPAVFIYDDPAYSFLDEIVEKHYFEGAKKQFLVELSNGEKVNKTYPGAAVLYLPFFLIAHMLAMLFGDPDGFSIIYQLLFEIGHFFYVFLAIGFFLKVLELKSINLKTSLLALIVLVFATNFFYYIAFDLSLIHVHSMALINATIYSVLLWQKHRYTKSKTLLLAGVTFGLALISRPTDVFLLLLLLVFLEDRLVAVSELIVKQWKVLLMIVGIVLLIFTIPISLWYWQADVFYAYSYGEEGFDFAHPELFNFLWSYNNGWLVYTPIVVFILPIGLWKLYQSSKIATVWSIVFYGITIYVFSSWWCWFYGCSFGQRTMVDFYLLIGYLVALIIKTFPTTWINYPVMGIVAFASFLNLHQSYQNFNGYLECGLANGEMYWDNFLSFHKKAKVYLLEGEEVIAKKEFPLDGEEDEISGLMVNSKEAYSGGVMTKTFSGNIFSATLRSSFHIAYDTDFLVFSCYVQQKSNLEATGLVIEQPDVPGSYKTYGIANYAIQDEWVKMEFVYELIDPEIPVTIYFWNGESDEECWFDQFEIKAVKR